MNASHRILLAALAVSVLALPGLAAAQDGGVSGRGRGGNPPAGARAERGDHPRRSPEQMLARMEQRLDEMKGPLGLDASQERRIREVLHSGAARARTVLTEQPEPSRARREALHAVRRDVRERIGAILTSEQRAQFHQMRRENRAERCGRRGRGPAR